MQIFFGGEARGIFCDDIDPTCQKYLRLALVECCKQSIELWPACERLFEHDSHVLDVD